MLHSSLVVAPIFADAVSSEFVCDASMEPISCASRVGESGSLHCDFQSNPAGSLSVIFDVADNTSVQLVGSVIMIGATSPGNAGNYSCAASNTIQGMERVAMREIRLLVGGM